MKLRTASLRGALLAALLATGSSFASIPIVSDVSPVLLAPRGSIRDMSGWIEVHNPTTVELRASVSSFTSPRGYTVELARDAVPVLPGTTVKLPFRMSVSGDGLYHVTVPVTLLGPTGATFGQVDGTLDLQVRDGSYAVDSFENLFMRPVSQERDEDGRSVLVFPSQPPRTDMLPSADYERARWSVESLEVITDEAVRDVTPGSEGDEVQSPTLPLPPPRDTSLPRHVDPEADRFTQESVDLRVRRAIDAQGTFLKGTAPQQLTSGVASGMSAAGSFNYMGLDGLLHPAWGWRVYAHLVIGSASVAIATTNVKPNGGWSVALPTVPTGFPIRITYEPRNVYFTIRSQAGSLYSFSSGALYTPATNKVLNEYKQAAYLSNSNLVGLGEVHRDGMDFWEALKTKGEGIDPVKTSSITLYYPNLTYDCGAGDKKPWSCANPDGEIWIIPAHATGSVLKHELGHQLQFKFWNGQTPDGSGGSHTLTGCFTAGLALSEGFANFMLVWSSIDRNQGPASNGFMNLENPGAAGACTTKNKNEMWVAANFWDFYDSVTDSKDNIYYVHTGLTPKLYLNNGKLNSMAEYLYIFMFKASQSHYTRVQEIFVQNKQW